MRIAIILWAATLACASGAADAGGSAAFSAADRPALCSPAFTNRLAFDLDEWSDNPLGLFESQRAPLTITPGYRRLSIDSAFNANMFVIPELLLGNPDIILFGLHYSHVQTEREHVPGYLLGLHQFGFRLAGKTERGLFQAGMRGTGFYGSVAAPDSLDKRVVMGVDELGLFLGSRVHPLVTLSFAAKTAVLLDTLNQQSNSLNEERFVSLAAPLFTVDADFGTGDFPLMTNFTLNIGRRHFVYVVKESGRPVINKGNQPAIVGDTLGWRLKTLVDVGSERVRLQPALHLGFWRTNYQLHEPAGDNHPTKYERELPDADWRFRDVTFGLGTGVEIFTWARAWIEYARSSLRLKIGDQLPGAPATLPEATKGFNRFGLGATGVVDAIPGISLPDWLSLSVKAGFEHCQQPPLFESFGRADYLRLNPISPRTQTYRYQPWAAMDQMHIFNTTRLGLHAGFLDAMFETDLSLGIIRGRFYKTGASEARRAGMELRLDLVYNLHAERE